MKTTTIRSALGAAALMGCAAANAFIGEFQIFETTDDFTDAKTIHLGAMSSTNLSIMGKDAIASFGCSQSNLYFLVNFGTLFDWGDEEDVFFRAGKNDAFTYRMLNDGDGKRVKMYYSFAHMASDIKNKFMSGQGLFRMRKMEGNNTVNVTFSMRGFPSAANEFLSECNRFIHQ